MLKRKLAENFKRLEQRVEDACHRAGRKSSSVTIVAVTKTVSLDVVRTLLEMGTVHLGENRVQELAKRAAMIKEWLDRRGRGVPPGTRPKPQWHMIGHLQRNKVKTVLPWIDLIHSLDSLRLAEEIDAQSAKLDRVTPALLQVNASGEKAKSGIAVAATTHLAEQLSTLKHLEIRGLMTMAPFTDDETVIHHTFERTRELFDEIVGERLCGPAFRELSMGMTSDFELAIEHGATYVRVGTALFEGIELSPRPAAIE